MYVYCVVCYRVIATYARSGGHFFAYLYILDDNSERPMDYKISLHANVFPFFFNTRTVHYFYEIQYSKFMTCKLNTLST